jgi:UvrB/uvrC motif
MPMRRDLDDAVSGWPYDAEPGEVIAREVRARDGRTVVQVRIELGVLQMEVGGRPDGTRPQGFATCLDYLRHRAADRAADPRETGPSWTMAREHCTAADREFVQFYHRREAWLALQRYDRALQDADHTIALMDFVCRHGIDSEYIDSHQRFRGIVLFHRTRAAAALALERRRPDEAIDLIREGAERINAHLRRWSQDHDESEIPNVSLVEQLQLLEDEVRKNFGVAKTLREQLAEAVAEENYERAAELRDRLRSRTRPR